MRGAAGRTEEEREAGESLRCLRKSGRLDTKRWRMGPFSLLSVNMMPSEMTALVSVSRTKCLNGEVRDMSSDRDANSSLVVAIMDEKRAVSANTGTPAACSCLMVRIVSRSHSSLATNGGLQLSCDGRLGRERQLLVVRMAGDERLVSLQTTLGHHVTRRVVAAVDSVVQVEHYPRVWRAVSHQRRERRQARHGA